MNIISDKLKIELNKLIEIGKNKKYELNYSIVFNLLVDQKYDLANIDEIINYFNKSGIDISFDDVEEEIDNGEMSEIINNLKPFDHSKIDIIMKPLTLDLLLKRLDKENNEINMSTEFQRKQGLWDNGKKSRLIESLMLKIPLPAFYFDGTNNDYWLVIDGLQRLTAIKEFFVDKTLQLSGLEFFTDLEGCLVNDLPRSFIRRMEESQIIAYIVNPTTPVNVKYNIFKRINTGGLELEPQEIRHALYQGKATKLLEELSNNENFLTATCWSIKKERMLDREFILRFIAFSEYGLDKYEGFIDSFLNDTMELINKFDENKINEIRYKFNNSMKLSYEIFGGYAFRKLLNTNRRSPINKALFDVWSTLLGQLNEFESSIIISNKNKLFETYKRMFNSDYEFISNINSGKIYSAKKRFEKINQLIQEALRW